MPFLVTGLAKDQPQTTTRARAASACQVAERWVRHGYADVQIKWRGHAFDLAGFRAQLRLTPDGIQALFEGEPVSDPQCGSR